MCVLSFTYEETGTEGTPCPGEGTQDQAGVSAFPSLVDPRGFVASLLGKTPEFLGDMSEEHKADLPNEDGRRELFTTVTIA